MIDNPERLSEREKEVAFTHGFVEVLWNHITTAGRLEFLKDHGFEGNDPSIVYKDFDELTDSERRMILAPILSKDRPIDLIRSWNSAWLEAQGAEGYSY